MAGHGVPNLRQVGFYVLIYVVRGQAIYSAEQSEKVMLGAGDMLLIHPGVRHSYQPIASEPWSEIWFCFEGSIFGLWRQSGLFGNSTDIRRLMPIEYWYRRLEVVLECGQRYGDTSALRLLCALQDVLAEVYGEGHHAADGDQVWLMKASAHIDVDNLLEADSFEEVAEQMDMSYDQFRRKFTKLSGYSPNAYRTARIMRVALLRKRGSPIVTLLSGVAFAVSSTSPDGSSRSSA